MMWTVSRSEFMLSEGQKSKKIAHRKILNVSRMKVLFLSIHPWCFITLTLDTFSSAIVFNEIFVFLIIGCGTSGLVPDEEDVIDVKVEPVEVSGYIE